MEFYIDVNNIERFKISDKNKEAKVLVKESLKLHHAGEVVKFDIAGIGILKVSNIILDFPLKSAIIKCELIDREKIRIYDI